MQRAHGQAGAFVSRLVVDRLSLAVVELDDLVASPADSRVCTTTSCTRAFDRLCSADLAPVTAFFNEASGKGSKERFFCNGEERCGQRAVCVFVCLGVWVFLLFVCACRVASRAPRE